MRCNDITILVFVCYVVLLYAPVATIMCYDAINTLVFVCYCASSRWWRRGVFEKYTYTCWYVISAHSGLHGILSVLASGVARHVACSDLMWHEMYSET